MRTWFTEIEPWTKQSRKRCRETWVAVFGLPLHVWSYEMFKKIARLWSDFVSIGGDTLKMLMTSQLQEINESITVQCGDERVFESKFCKKEHRREEGDARTPDDKIANLPLKDSGFLNRRLAILKEAEETFLLGLRSVGGDEEIIEELVSMEMNRLRVVSGC